MLNVVCYKWGFQYSNRYVNTLYSMVQRHLSIPHNFICFTDDSSGFNENIDARPLEPELGGWWTRFNLFNPNNGIKGRILAIDIDTVITGSLDDIGNYSGEAAFLRDFQLPDQDRVKNVLPRNRGRTWLGTGLMSFESGWGTFLYELLKEKYGQIDHDFHNCQQYVGCQLYLRSMKPDLWQDMFPNQLCSYRYEKLNNPSFFRKFHDLGLRMVCFHGQPKPEGEAQKGVAWVNEHWR